MILNFALFQSIPACPLRRKAFFENVDLFSLSFNFKLFYNSNFNFNLITTVQIFAAC